MMKRRPAVIAAILVAVAAVVVMFAFTRGGGGSRQLTSSEIDRVNELLTASQQQRLDGQIDEAEASLREVLDIDSGNSLARFNLGQLLRNRNDYAAAAREFRKVVADRPDMEEAQIEYVLSLRDADQVPDAISHLRDVVAQYPSVLKYKLLLGRLLVRQGEFEEGDNLVGDVLRIDSTLEEWNP